MRLLPYLALIFSILLTGCLEDEVVTPQPTPEEACLTVEAPEEAFPISTDLREWVPYSATEGEIGFTKADGNIFQFTVSSIDGEAYEVVTRGFSETKNCTLFPEVELTSGFQYERTQYQLLQSDPSEYEVTPWFNFLSVKVFIAPIVAEVDGEFQSFGDGLFIQPFRVDSRGYNDNFTINDLPILMQEPYTMLIPLEDQNIAPAPEFHEEYTFTNNRTFDDVYTVELEGELAIAFSKNEGVLYIPGPDGWWFMDYFQ